MARTPAENQSIDQAKRVLMAAVDAVARREKPDSLLSVREVRAVAGLTKSAFDRAALALAKERRVVLHYHDFPASLSEYERAQLIRQESPKGATYYVGIAKVPT